MAPSTPIEVVQSLLQNPTDDAHVASLVAPNATYQSLSYADSNRALTKILPYVSLKTVPLGCLLLQSPPCSVPPHQLQPSMHNNAPFLLRQAGLHPSSGPSQIASTFRTVSQIWQTDSFSVQTVFSSGSDVALFGSFVYTSRTLGKSIKSPFSIHAVVEDVEGKLMITYMQFLEDTLGTTGVFKREEAYGVYVVDPVTRGEVDA